MSAITFPKTLQEAIVTFADKEVAWQFAVQLRWPDGAICPFCGSKEHSFLSTRKTWQCKGCGKQFSVKKGSIFEDSPLGFDKWLTAMWLIANAKNGISSYELHRTLGITQKSAWFVNHRIRLAMRNGTFEKLSGDVEADETGIGGLSENMHKVVRDRKITGRGSVDKTTVAGLLQRDGKIVVRVINNRTAKTLQSLVRFHVVPGSNLHTDAFLSYEGLSQWYTHAIVDHSVQYVRDNVNTNGLENFWSLLKRTMRGTYVSVEPFHLHRYLDEYSFRFNSRKDNDGVRFLALATQTAGKRLTYQKLIGAVGATGN